MSPLLSLSKGRQKEGDSLFSNTAFTNSPQLTTIKQQPILRIALPSPYSQVTLTSSPHLSVTDPLPLATNKDSQELWDCLRGLNPLDSGQEDTFNP